MRSKFLKVLFLHLILVAALQVTALADVILRVGETRYIVGDQVSCVSDSGGGGGTSDVTANSCFCEGNVGKLHSENDFTSYDSTLYVYNSQSECGDNLNSFKYCKAPYARMVGRFNVCGCDDNIAYVHTIRPKGQSTALRLYEYSSASSCVEKIFTWPQCK